jgi:tetratricopeptide (TPR) repeat protein
MSSTPDFPPVPSPENRRRAAEHYTAANQWIVAHQPEKALPLLLHCCRLDPTSLVYRQLLRTAQRGQLPKNGPLSRLRKWTLVRMLDRLVKSKQWLAVLQAAEELLCLHPANESAHLALAVAFEELGLIEHAIWCLEEAGPLNQSSGAARSTLIRLYERVGRFTLARELAAAGPFIDKQPKPQSADANDFELLQQQAQTQMETLRRDISVAQERLSGNTTDQELIDILGRLRHELHCREIELCRQRADRFSTNLEWRLELGVLLLKTGQFDAALDEFQAARADEKLVWRALVYAGYCHLNRQQWRKALPLFEQALPMIPEDAAATRDEVIAILQQSAGRM